MNLHVGQKVRFLNTEGGGVILKIINSNLVLIEDDHGFEQKVSLSDLVINSEMELPDPYGIDDNSPVQLKKEDAPRKFLKRTKKKKKEIIEVDLHIEELVENHRGMSNAEIVITQLSVFERELGKAIKNRLKRIVFIHGVGQGVLREEIHKLLRDYENCEFHDASYTEFGAGATEVIIHPYRANYL